MSTSPTIQDAARELEEEFALLDDWRDKVEFIIELGKELPPLPDALKTEGNKVRGCQSQVWLVAEPEPGGRIHLRADSDAVLVKGLISLLLRPLRPAHAAGDPGQPARGAGAGGARQAADARAVERALRDGGADPGHGRGVRVGGAGLTQPNLTVTWSGGVLAQRAQRFCRTSEAMITPMVTSAISTVQTALISGVTPRRTEL